MQLLRSAETAVGSDEALAHRVRVAQLPLLYTFLVRWDALRQEARASATPWPVEDHPRAVYDRFMKTAKAENVTMVAEGRGLDWLESVVKQP
jgi:hypothetical protein